ncbi:hypothetical protein QQM79_09685 [Marinobacteraceae bacterium S3BR75-40.1]
MRTLIFSGSSLFHLKQLEAQYHRRLGQRFRLADEGQRLELLRQSAHCRDQVVRKYFRRFCQDLDPTTRDTLIEEGVFKESETLH